MNDEPVCRPRLVGLWLRPRLHPALPSLIAFVLFTFGAAASQPKHRDTKSATAQPVAPALRIPTEPLGFAPPNSTYLMYQLSSNSLDFIDATHLLFTFREAGLLKRLPGEPEDDHDQMIRAVVLALPGGDIVNSTEWRLHDRERYLWPLGGGRFLLRQRDSLFLTDASLQLEPLLNVESHIQSVGVSPDRQLLTIQADAERHTAEEHKTLVDQAKAIGGSPPKEDIKLVVIDLTDRTAIARSTAPHAVDFPVIQRGYVETLSAKAYSHWLLRYVPFTGTPRIIADVPSSCQPTVKFLNGETVLVNQCKEKSDEHLIQALSMDGKTLWQQRWDTRYVWPTFAYSENGERFAYSSLQLSHSIGALEPVDDDIVRAEVVGAFDTVSGKLRILKNAAPVSSAGQNFALSPDGNRFAILREGAIEVYDLPPLSAPSAAPESGEVTAPTASSVPDGPALPKP
jgi:hypothetical protein